MAFRLSRVNAPLAPDKTMELGHHILKAHIYKSVGRQRGYSSRDMQAFWMCLSSHGLSQALVTHRNIFSPNVKVLNKCGREDQSSNDDSNNNDVKIVMMM